MAEIALGPDYDFGDNPSKYGGLLELGEDNVKHDDSWTLFVRGLLWAYAFFHDESLRCFRTACNVGNSTLVCTGKQHFERAIRAALSRHHLILKCRITCLQAHWGAAYTLGPNYNEIHVDEERLDEARVHITMATDLVLAGMGYGSFLQSTTNTDT